MAENTSNLAKGFVERTLAVPSADSPVENFNQVSIIKGLSTTNSTMRILLMLRGYSYDPLEGSWVQRRRPIMNELGIGNFMTALEGVGDNVNFSYTNEKDIPKLAYAFFADNYPHFIVFNDEFELAPCDINAIKTILKFWSFSVFNNSKNAGHRNVVRGTLSEGILAKALGNGTEEKKKGGLFGLFKRGKKE
jgi:hypothetical protein